MKTRLCMIKMELEKPLYFADTKALKGIENNQLKLDNIKRLI